MSSRLAAILLLAVVFLASAQAAQEIVIATYNLENYVSASPKGPGDKSATRAKPEEAIAAVIRIVKEVNPDILGVCEMGSLAVQRCGEEEINEESVDRAIR